MKASWLWSAPAGILLGSAIPPSPLGYDPGLLDNSNQPCALTFAHSCADQALSSDDATEEPPAPPPPPPLDRGVRLVVSLPQQRLYVFSDGDLIATSAVSTGKRGHGTPTGSFHVLQKQLHHRSNLYSDAPMPYMQRLTEGGVALHAGHVPGYPASHGCIRLPWAMAKRLYSLTNFSTTVTVTRGRPHDAGEAFELLAQPPVRTAPTALAGTAPLVAAQIATASSK